MTDEERWALIVQRLEQLDKSIDRLEAGQDELVQANKDVWRILGKVRADEEVVKHLSITLDKIDGTISTLWTKHDKLKDIVLPRHESWTEAAQNQKKFMTGIVTMFFVSLAGVLGVKLS